LDPLAASRGIVYGIIASIFWLALAWWLLG